jgi:hypothetical protein
LAGAESTGPVPERGTAIDADAPNGIEVNSMSAVDFAPADTYFKLGADQILASPRDQTSVNPQNTSLINGIWQWRQIACKLKPQFRAGVLHIMGGRSVPRRRPNPGHWF